MRVFDINKNELSDKDIDLSKGSLMTTFIIKDDAEPIDNVHKFAYTDEDYEQVQIYQPYPETEHTVQDDTDVMLVELAYRVTLLELGVEGGTE